MNEETVKGFIQFYVSSFNDKTKSSEFFSLWKEYSTLVFNNNKYTGKDLADVLTEIYNNFIIDISTLKINVLTVGDRRTNILLTYNFINKSNYPHRTSQYIQLAYSNEKEYWIHSSLLSID
jgi:hypothetical protein